MKLSKICCLLILIGVFTTGKSQAPVMASNEYPEHKYYPLKGKVFYSAYRQVKGSAFFAKDWIHGSIYLSNGQSVKDILFKFDLHKHEFLIFNEYLKQTIKLDSDAVSSIEFLWYGKTHLYRGVSTKNKLIRAYDRLFLEVLLEGSFPLRKLVLYERVALQPVENQYFEEFVSKEKYYLLINDEFKNISLRKSQLKQFFPEQKPAIRNYIKSNKLQVKKEDDFILVVKHFSSSTPQ